MTKIRYIKDEAGNNFYPKTHVRAVYDSNGNRLDEILENIDPGTDPSAVKFIEQSLTSEQKTQARLNIGAGTSNFSGSYNELSDKPVIPVVPVISTDISADSASDSKTASAKAVKTYVDAHSGGSDPEAVKYTEQVLTDIQKSRARENIGACGSADVSPSASEINLYPTVNYTAQSLTSAQKTQARQNIGAGTSDFSGDYRDLSNKPTIPTVPTTSTDINTDRYNNDKVAGTKAVYDEVHPKVETVRYSWGMSPNVMYNLGELTGNVVFLFATPEDNTIVNHYYFCFDAGSTPPTVIWPVEITDWFGNSAPTIIANHHYEVSVINGVAAYLEV